MMRRRNYSSVLFIAFFVAIALVGALIGVSVINGKELLFREPFAQNMIGIPTPEPFTSLIPAVPPVEKPITIQILAIGVDAKIEEVGLDSLRRMDVPKEAANVGWYHLGVKPGEKGNAVIDGHFDRADGSPAVFYDVQKLKIGDLIRIHSKDNRQLEFQITQVKMFDFDQVPIAELFGPSEKKLLNLITCNGTFDQKTKNYSKRLVVYAELKE